MLVVGLTGGIGSGKSTVADMFAQLGTPIIDADVIARELTQPDHPAFLDIIDHFDAELLQSNGTIDRAKLRDVVFSQPSERIWLENLLHPLILEEMKSRITTLKGPYCIAVIPLLFESGPHVFIDRILTVDSPEHLQVERVFVRDKTEKMKIQAILASQVSRQVRISQSDDVITNNGVKDHLIPQVESLHLLYTQLGSQSQIKG